MLLFTSIIYLKGRKLVIMQLDNGKHDGNAKRVGKQEIQKCIGKRKGKETGSKMSKVFMLANKSLTRVISAEHKRFSQS